LASLGAGALGGQGANNSPPPPVLGSTVAHHDSVGARRSDRLTLCPLLTASLGLESNPLADQFTLTGTARANRLECKPCCHEFCFGGGGEVHAVLCCVLCVYCTGWGRCPSIEQQGSDRLNACLICFDGDPCHGVALVGAAPDHSILL